MPVDSAFESRSFNLTRAPGLNSGVPPPSMIAFTAMRNSSISPCSVKSAARSALPNKKNVLCAFALQSGHRIRHVGAKYLRVSPRQLLERAREHIFRQRVHEVRDLAGRSRPVVRHQLIGDAAEHQPSGGFALVDRDPLEFLAPAAERPGDVAVR